MFAEELLFVAFQVDLVNSMTIPVIRIRVNIIFFIFGLGTGVAGLPAVSEVTIWVHEVTLFFD